MSKDINREAMVAVILSGVIPCMINSKMYFIHPADPINIFESKAMYEETYRKAELQEVLTEQEMLAEMTRIQGGWNKFDSSLLEKIPKEIEELKVGLYDAFYKFKKRENIAKNLQNKKTQHGTLLMKKTEYKDTTCEGIAELVRKKYVIGMSTYDEHGNKLFNRESIHKADDVFLRKIVSAYYQSIPTEEDLRDMVTHEPWKGYWNAAKVEGSLFGHPASKLSELQRIAIMWSRIYENVYEHPECPPDELIAEADILDGWLIVQSRKNESERKKKFGEKNVDKAQGADEVFVMVEDVKDIQRVSDMMTPEAKFAKKQRMSQIKQQGTVQEQHMSDSRLKIQSEAMQQYRQHVAGSKKGRR